MIAGVCKRVMEGFKRVGRVNPELEGVAVRMLMVDRVPAQAIVEPRGIGTPARARQDVADAGREEGEREDRPGIGRGAEATPPPAGLRPWKTPRA